MRTWALVAGISLGLIMSAFAVQGAAKAEPVQGPVVTVPQQGGTIFDYKKELGLTDKQEADLKALMDNLQKNITGIQQKLQAGRQELNGLVQNKADMKVIRKQVEKISAIQVDAMCLDIETSQKVEKILTSAQIAQWKDIQVKFRQSMMSQAAQAAGAK